MNPISRRDFCAGTGALAATLLVGVPRRSWAANRPALPIPAELRADSAGTIELVAEAGRRSFLPGAATPTYGFNAPFLGSAVRVPRGKTVTMDVTNRLSEDITVHWHGLIIPGQKDGGPYHIIPPGKSWTVQLPIDQPAATLWFHPHLYPATAELVIKGLAGLFIVDDEESDALGLPSRWGIDDIPLILQDRRFNPDGSFFHRFNEIAVAAGYVGDLMLVNGAPEPVAKTARGWLRFRILNGSNARNYRLVVADNRSLYVVGSDGGLLAAPVELKELAIAAGERYEVLIDARDGKPFDLLSLPVRHQPIMRLPPFDQALTLLSVKPNGADGSGKLPDALVELPAIPVSLPPVTQGLVMQMYRDAEGRKLMMESGLMAMTKAGKTDPAVVARVVDLITNRPALPLKDQLTANGINGKSFSFTEKGLRVPIGTDMVWAISEETDTMLHPVHIHGCQFRIVKVNGAEPPAHMAGWKDTVPIENAGNADIYLRFPLAAPDHAPYMAHCHILEHEDSGMMTEFSVG
jgi:blue copper oxidase